MSINVDLQEFTSTIYSITTFLTFTTNVIPLAQVLASLVFASLTKLIKQPHNANRMFGAKHAGNIRSEISQRFRRINLNTRHDSTP